MSGVDIARGFQSVITKQSRVGFQIGEAQLLSVKSLERFSGRTFVR
jgi:hypothetical protein